MINMEKNKCPKCGFNLTDTYCVKCGYNKNVFITDVSKTDIQNDIERYMQDDYQKVVYNKNLLLIFLLGPLYFSYFKFYMLGFLLFIIDFLISYGLNYIYSPLGLGIEPLVIFYFINRTLYLILSNALLIKLIKNRLIKIKAKNPTQFKEKIFSETACSKFSLFISILFVFLFLILFLIWYRIKNGTLSF